MVNHFIVAQFACLNSHPRSKYACLANGRQITDYHMDLKITRH
jgi:hypothetical protein